MHKIRRRSTAAMLLSSSALVALAALTTPAFAQQGAPPSASTAVPSGQSPAEVEVRQAGTAREKEEAAVSASNGSREISLDEVVVTGSSIRGVAPVGSALIGVTRETITATAPANTKELLASIPQLGNFGANAEQSTSNRFRTAGYQPNIHNLGIYATLTLLNGHRIAPVGGEAVFPDPSIVPVIAVQRVELIADGASAIYGSDAVAGVVNFIYRKPFDGVELSATYGFNDTRYEKRDFAIIGGKTWTGGGAMLAYEYSDNKSPWNTEIPTIALGGDQTSRGGRDLRGTVCLLPTIRAVDANGRPTGTTYQYPTNSTNVLDQRCGVLNQQTVVPDGDRHAVLFTADHQVTENVKLWTEINYSYYETTRYQGRQTLNLIVPRTNPYFASAVPPALAGANQIYVIRSGLGLFPQVIGKQYSEVTALTVGADIDLAGDWKGTLMAHASRTRDFNSDPELDLVNAQRAANGTTTATALNPFGQAADNNAAVLASINNGFTQDNKTSQRLRELQFKADGPLFSIPGGEIRAALGVDFRQDQAKQLQFAGSNAPGASFAKIVRNDNINRSIMAGFYELNVPVVSDQNAMPLVRKLTLSLSGRYDYYENYGGQFNPKYGVVWSPVDDLNIHASYGTNFAAPNAGLITSIFGVPQPNQGYNMTVAAGPYAGERLGTVNVYNLGGGNPDLQPEEAKTYSVGFDYAPTWSFFNGLRFAATYYYVQYSNLIYKPTSSDIITNPAFINSRVIHPTQAQIDAAIAFAPPQQPITTSYDVLFNSYAINLGARNIGGVDLDAAYSLTTDNWGAFNFAINANRQTTYEQEVVPGTGFSSRLGTSDAPHWKTRYSATWSMDPVTVAAFINYISGFKNTSITPNQDVESFTTVDLTAQYEFKNLPYTKGLTLQVRAANLFDKDPPFYDAAAGYFPALASPFGRTIDVTLRAKF